MPANRPMRSLLAKASPQPVPPTIAKKSGSSVLPHQSTSQFDLRMPRQLENFQWQSRPPRHHQPAPKKPIPERPVHPAQHRTCEHWETLLT
ncbi:hypothetical protein TYRP_018236 [Tyrophagus putrescentiae]|nr:hypothetical protein TYRP_018236 [Tyrophagus putrescentiae]